MNRKKIKVDDLNTLLTSLMPNIESETRHQIHSLLSLVITTLVLTVSFTSAAVAQNNDVLVVKTVLDVGENGPNANVTAANEIIRYQINVTNPSGVNITSSDVNVSDPMFGGTLNISNATSSLGNESWDEYLNESESWIYILNYTVTQEDLNSNGNGTGFINNTATVAVNGSEVGNATASVLIDQNANFTVEKMVTNVSGHGPGGYVNQTGDVISYQINVTNTGNIDITNETIKSGNITDSLFNLTLPQQSISNNTVLEVGEIWTFNGNYTVSQADIDSNGNETGFIINNVTIISDIGSKNANVSTPIANCTIEKTVTNVTGNGSGNITAAGDIISYKIVVDNRGQVNLTNVTVTDPLLGGQLNVTDLGIGSNETLYGNYTVTQADLNNNGNSTGFIVNNATVFSDQLSPKNATVSTPILQNANFSVEKAVTNVSGHGPGGYVAQAGDVIAYEINVTNTGNIDFTNESIAAGNITDSLFSLTLPTQSISNNTVFEVGEVWTFTGNYTVSQNDIATIGNETGFITNNVSVNSLLGPRNDTVSTPIANFTIRKTVTNVTGNGNGNVTAAGDIINYQIVVDNRGQVNLTNVTVADPMIGLVNNVTDLGIGSNVTLYGNYTVTQEDINNNGNGTGFLMNNVTVFSDQLDPRNANVTTSNASVFTHIIQDPNYTIVKTVEDVNGVPEGNVTIAGDIIAYSINVTNTGNVDLYNVTVTDPLIDDLEGPTGSLDNDTVLNVGESWIFTGDYTATQEDININGTLGDGFIINNATVVGNYTVSQIYSEELDLQNSTAQVYVERNPSYSLFKAVIDPDPRGDCIINKAGDAVPYRIVMQNDGNVDLTNVTVEDPLVSLIGPTGDDYDPDIMNPGETWVFNGTYNLTQDDVDSGILINNATVTCDQLPENGTSLETLVDQNPDLSIYKSVTGIDEAGDFMINYPGDIINYQVAVKNNGDVSLTNVIVDDPMVVTLEKKSGDNKHLEILDPGETWVYTGDYEVSSSDIDTNGDGTGFITNTAYVTCEELSEESSTIQIPIISNVDIQTDTDSDNTSAKVYPVADFSTSVTSGYAPLSVQFTDKSTGSPTSWSWDFNGDGTSDSSVQNPPAYTYTTAGTYTANLTVSNANGSASKPETITVLQTSGSSSGSSGGSGSGGSSVGSANVVSSSSSTTTPASPNATQTVTSTPSVVQTPPASEPTPAKNNTSKPVQPVKRTPGFEVISGITALLGAIYLYRRR